MNELINCYFYNANTKKYTHSGVVEYGDTIPTNATTIPPVVKLSDTTARSMIDPYFDVENNCWVEHDPKLLMQKTIMQQSQQITLLQSTVMQQNQESAGLKAANAQQTTQIKQLQQMFMLANQQQAIEKAKEVTA